MATLLTLNGVQFDPALNLPRLPLDGLDGAGVMLIHDYRRPRCLAPGPLTEVQAVRNLSRNVTPGIDDGVLDNPGAMLRDGDGIRFSRPNGGDLADFIRANGSGRVPLTAGDDWVITAWVRQNTADDFQGIVGSAANTEGNAAENSFGLLINGSIDPWGVTGWLWNTAGQRIQFGAPTKMPPGAAAQISLGMTFDGANSASALIGVNGAVVATAPVGAWHAPIWPLQIGTTGTTRQGAATISRVTLTQTGSSQRYATPADVIARDWELNQSLVR